MQGDPVIDRLMQPVAAAIKRHVERKPAFTDIYNRVYEALMNGMIVLDTMREQLSKANARAKKAEAELAVLREQTRWIPVSEMLPEVIEQVLCYAPHYHSIEVRWTDQLGEAVTHWRPLPEPPEEE